MNDKIGISEDELWRMRGTIRILYRYLPLVEKVTLKNLIIYDVANSLVGISTRNLRLAR